MARSGPPDPAEAERLGHTGWGAGPKFRDPDQEVKGTGTLGCSLEKQVPHIHPPWWAQAPSRAGQEVPEAWLQRMQEGLGDLGLPGPRFR